MPIRAEQSDDRTWSTIYVSGRFDFKSHKEFRNACTKLVDGSPCVIDLSDTTYLDSSALGMLLMLRDDHREVRIVNCPDEVREVLKMANFQDQFYIE